MGAGEVTMPVVAVRTRPFTLTETSARAKTIVNLPSKRQCVVEADPRKAFEFDHCFASHDAQNRNFATQGNIYDEFLGPMINEVARGRHATLLCVGEADSGKSSSIFGDP